MGRFPQLLFAHEYKRLTIDPLDCEKEIHVPFPRRRRNDILRSQIQLSED
jgi:hypothetical protein